MFDMASEFLHVVDALLSDENGAAFETDQTECLLMNCLHVAAQAFLVRERVFCRTISDQTCECS